MNTETGEIRRFDEDEARKLTPIWKPIDEAKLSLRVRNQLEAKGIAWVTRNSPCPCGSRKRFKRCCMTVAP